MPSAGILIVVITYSVRRHQHRCGPHRHVAGVRAALCLLTIGDDWCAQIPALRCCCPVAVAILFTRAYRAALHEPADHDAVLVRRKALESPGILTLLASFRAWQPILCSWDGAACGAGALFS